MDQGAKPECDRCDEDRGRHVLTADIEIAAATAEDVDGILDLQERNQPERGGMLSARLPGAWLAAAVASASPMIARRGGRVVGYGRARRLSRINQSRQKFLKRSGASAV
jgi:hypothetical protein